MNTIQNCGMANYQMTFMAKGNKAAYEFIDRANDMAKEFTKSTAEKKEIMLRRSVSNFVSIFKRKPKTNEINDEFCKNLIKIAQEEGMAPEYARTKLINHSILTGNFSEGGKTLKLIEQVHEARIQAYLEELKKSDPELYKATIEKMTASMSFFEMAKNFAKNMFKKS